MTAKKTPTLKQELYFLLYSEMALEEGADNVQVVATVWATSFTEAVHKINETGNMAAFIDDMGMSTDVVEAGNWDVLLACHQTKGEANFSLVPVD